MIRVSDMMRARVGSVQSRIWRLVREIGKGMRNIQLGIDIQPSMRIVQRLRVDSLRVVGIRMRVDRIRGGDHV
jgi:hypothetical protein